MVVWSTHLHLILYGVTVAIAGANDGRVLVIDGMLSPECVGRLFVWISVCDYQQGPAVVSSSILNSIV
jgi:hypothetical protein